MRKSDSKVKNETLEEENIRLQKELAALKSTNARLIASKDNLKAKYKKTKAELKKKDVKTITVTEEQKRLLSTLLPDIDILSL